MQPTTIPPRRLVIVLGDQLDPDASAFVDFDPARDAVWMAEVTEESTHVWSTKPRTAIFLSAMRHFRMLLQERGITVHYLALSDPDNLGTLALALDSALTAQRPEQIAMTAPGDWRVLHALRDVARRHSLPLLLSDDRHFYSTVREFADHARTHAPLRMEYWYREMRQRFDILMEHGKPVGGRWNFDTENRSSFGKTGPRNVPAPTRFAPDAITLGVIQDVETHFANHPGSLASFAWPVTRDDALIALDDFITHRLPEFGKHQDAMWTDEPWLYHSHLSSSMNLKLLGAREVVDAAVNAWRAGHAPLASVEGFVRQIIGWREYVRGVYWTQMPGYPDRNALDATHDLPAFYWTADTDMACLRAVIGQTLDHGYAHHIQRLMVTGLYALLLGVRPRDVHAWYLAVYVDAVEWVEMPNTIGMSQYADGGIMGSKPYVASGRYIDRMSNYCKGCRFDPGVSTGSRACPFTTLYWDFLLRHETRLQKIERMKMPLKHLDRLDDEQRDAVRAQAALHRAEVGAGPASDSGPAA